MDPAPVSSLSFESLAPCSESCRYAEKMRGEYLDWIWCTRPGASTRVVHAGDDCARFAALGSPSDLSAKSVA